MIDWLQGLAAELLYVAALSVIMIITVYVAIKVDQIFGDRSPNWLRIPGNIALGIGIFFVLIVIAGPAITALQREACKRSGDYDLCMNG